MDNRRLTSILGAVGLAVFAGFVLLGTASSTTYYFGSVGLWPAGVPTPAAIPTPRPLNNPVTVGPGTHGVLGNGSVNSSGIASGTDDTSAFQNLLAAGDIIVQAGTYRIDGNVTIPTGRSIQCQPGATFLDGQTATTFMFSIGYWAGTGSGNNQITGCTFEGTDVPAGANNYANYHGGTSGYSELFVIGTGNGTHPDNILIENNTFKDGQGDHLITYSSCGTAQTGAANCNSGAPGTEGPSHITIYNNTFQHCAQPGLHINGGQNIHIANNTFTDCDDHGEEDNGVLQVMTGIMWNNNSFITDSFGWMVPNSGLNAGSEASCMGSSYIAADGTGCWFVDNALSGRGTQLYEGNTSCAGETFKPGNYSSNVVIGGAFINTGC